jgi:glycerate dehydrogenase
MKLVVLDGFTTNPGDLTWDDFAPLGELIVYDHTPAQLTAQRLRGTALAVTNKTLLGREVIAQLPELRYIGLLSTGYNVVDLAAARERKIPVTNIPAYCTASVAQQVFALLLELTNHAQAHSNSVQAGDWSRCRDFCYTVTNLMELDGKTMGIVGLGRIGRQVAGIARAFGMRVLACDPISGEAGATLEDVLAGSDVLTLHCPLTNETQGLINMKTIEKMKRGAVLINTSRGPLLNEADVAQALQSGKLAGVGVDVLSAEPPAAQNPLLHAPNCVITPHIAWASKEARRRLLRVAAENLRAFLQGAPQNVVNF